MTKNLDSILTRLGVTSYTDGIHPLFENRYTPEHQVRTHPYWLVFAPDLPPNLIHRIHCDSTCFISAYWSIAGYNAMLLQGTLSFELKRWLQNEKIDCLLMPKKILRAS